MKTCVITGAARTAVGAYLGSLKTVEAQDLCAAAIVEAAKRSDIELGELDEVIMGDVYGYTPNVSRCAALVAGVPEEIPAYVVDRQCASSLQAVVSACQQIMSEEADVVMAGGVEVMSRLPFYLDSDDCRSGVTDWNLLLLATVRILHQLAHAVGPVAGDSHRG